MDDSSRMMHFPQGFGMGLGEHQQPTSPQSQQHPGSQEGQGEVGGVQDGVVGHASINTILDQIMNITDQSLDEAQVSFLLLFLGQTFQIEQHGKW